MRPMTWLAAAFSLVVLTSALPALAADDIQSLVGKPAPAFSLTTTDGKTVAVADQKGKVVVVDFWATWCPPCRLSLPHVQEMSANKDWAAKGLVVWAVNARETPDVINKFVSDNHYAFSVPMDSTGATLGQYLVTGIPTTVIVGRDGLIKNIFVGYGDGVGKTIDDAVKAVLDEPAK